MPTSLVRRTAFLVRAGLLAALLVSAGPAWAQQALARGAAAPALPGLPASAVAASALSQGLSLRAAPLGGSAYYDGLLRRQQAGEVLDLSGVTRPGIAFVSNGRLGVSQGSGRFESLRAGQAMDLFVPQDQPLPLGVTVVARDIPAEIALKANLLSSRGEAGSNPELVGFITEGRTFVRVLAPRELVSAPLSRAVHEVEELRAFLAEQAAAWDSGSRPELESFLSSPALRELSVREQRLALGRLAEAVPRGPDAVLPLLR